MDAAPPPGLLASLRRLAATSLELVAVRIELLGTELEQEKQRVFDALIRGAVALVLLGLALVLFIAFVLMLVQPQYRLAAVGVLAALLAAGGVWLLRSARERIAAREGAFAATLGELRRDRAGLGPTQ